MHCVQNTVGAAIYPELFQALNQTEGQLEVLYKGNLRDKEEYSVFQNTDSALRLKTILSQFEIERIDICGIAGGSVYADPSGREAGGRRFCDNVSPF